jgi:hypothetical protein
VSFRYSETPFVIRSDIAEAHRRFRDSLASPGSWWTGAQRVAIAEESRQAVACGFCKVRKKALSPYGSAAAHQARQGLSDTAVDAVHRVVTDQNRITQRWIEDNDTRDLKKPAYVEVVGIVVATFRCLLINWLPCSVEATNCKQALRTAIHQRVATWRAHKRPCHAGGCIIAGAAESNPRADLETTWPRPFASGRGVVSPMLNTLPESGFELI